MKDSDWEAWFTGVMLMWPIVIVGSAILIGVGLLDRGGFSAALFATFFVGLVGLFSLSNASLGERP
jgi:hypothetical protein